MTDNTLRLFFNENNNTRFSTSPHLCWYSHCSCTVNQFAKHSHHTKSSSSWRKDFKESEKEEKEFNRTLLNKLSGYGCNSSQAFSHLIWMVAAEVHGYSNLHQTARKFLYGSKNGPLLNTMNAVQGFAADSLPLQQLANWSADSGIFIHPGIEFIRSASDYRDYRLRARSDAMLPYLTPLIIVPASCLIGFTDPEDDAEKKDMLRGTAIAAGVAVENKMEEQGKQQQQQQQNTTSTTTTTTTTTAEDVCKFFFDSLSLLVNDCLSAENNSTSDTRHLFSRMLISGTRTLKNAPYLSDRDFAVVGSSCPLAEAFRHMVHNFVDNGPLSGKVEKALLQTAVSLALSHATVLPMRVKRPVDHLGNLIRGSGWNNNKNDSNDEEENDEPRQKNTSHQQKLQNPVIEVSPGGLGVVPWLHMLPHGGQVLNAVAVSISSEDAPSVVEWISQQVPTFDFVFEKNNKNSATTNNGSGGKNEKRRTFSRTQRIMKDGFVMLIAAEDIGPCEEVCSQMMAPLNPVRVAPVTTASILNENRKNGNKINDKEDEDAKREELPEQQYQMDKEYDETLAMWMITTASAPSDEESLPSSEAKFIQSCITDAVNQEVQRMKQDRR